MDKEKRKRGENLQKLALFFSLAWKISPAYILILIANALIGGGQILANVILPKFLVDELVGQMRTRELLLYAGLIIGGNLLFAFLTNTVKRLIDVKNIYMRQSMSRAMADKIMSIEYGYLEDPYYLDLKERGVFAISNQSALENLINNAATALKSAVTLIGLMAVMFTLSWVLVLLLCAAFATTLLFNQSFRKFQLRFFEQLIPVNRRYGYYVGLTFDDKIQKDARLYGMAPMIADRITYYNADINSWFTKFNRRYGRFNGLVGIIGDLQAALAYGYVGIRVITDRLGPKIGLGSFTMYVSSAISFSTTFTQLGNSIITINQMLGYLDPFFEFMRIPDQKESGGHTVFEDDIESIEFDDVTFTYPKCEKPVLKNISFKIKGGEKISIVGLNGAGKTTLIKLICRLYKPDSGTIKINGTDIFEYDHESYMARIAAVFQDYRLFAFGIDENITCQPSGTNEGQIDELLVQVGLKGKIESQPKGVKTMLGKAYSTEGVELSGGESQKVAIARALYKNASLIILDEPTSALDPLAEADIYANFNKLVGDKTAFYISHRMSSSVFCDRILIIQDGIVADFDTHAALMAKKDSLYFKLFNSQAENYKE